MASELRPAKGNTRILIFDDVGLLTRLTVEQAEKALEDGQIVPDGREGVAHLVPQPVTPLSEEEKYKLRKKQERRNR